MDPHLLEGPVAKVALTLRELTIEINQISNWEEEKQGTKEIMDILPLLLPLISLDHWICIFSIFMLIMVNNMSPTAWDHLFSTLQSILSTMRIHMTSVSGISPLPRLFTSEEFPPYDDIIIPMRIFSLFKEFKGEIFRTNNRVIIGIPVGEWLRYGEGDMSFGSSHNFEQAAWTQVCQFHPMDLMRAFQSMIPFSEVKVNVKTWQQYYIQNQYKSHYIQLLYKTKVYLLLEKWYQGEVEQVQRKEREISRNLENNRKENMNTSYDQWSDYEEVSDRE